MAHSLTGKFVFNASENQERLWFLHSYDNKASAAYNIAVAYQITGEINRVNLQKSYNLIIERHEALRTGLIREDGNLQQAIEPHLKLTLNYEDLSNINADRNLDIVLNEKMRSNANRCFELSKPGLIRAVLYKISLDRYYLLLVVHHSICDGASLQIISKELFQAYEDLSNHRPSSLTPIEYHYADYVEWFNKEKLTNEYSNEINYWKDLFEGNTNSVSIKTTSTANNDDFIGATKTFKLSSDQATDIAEFCKKYSVTKYSFLLSVYAYLIHIYTKSDDFLIGIPVENRTQSEFEGVVGYFANTLLARIQVQEDSSIISFIKSIGLQISKSLSHQKIEFSKLVDIIQPHRDNQTNNVFRMLFGYQEIQNNSYEKGCIKVRSTQFDTGLSKFDCSLYFFNSNSEISCVVEYNSGISDNQIDEFICKYKHIVKYFLRNSQVKLSKINLRDGDNHFRLSGPKRDIFNILNLISNAASQNPEKTAISSKDKHISYRELDSLTSRIANALLNGSGLKQGDVVGIYLPRSIDLVVAILGAAKAGIAYVPFTCIMPLQRKKHMIKDSNLKFIISSSHLNGIPEDIRLIDIEDLKSNNSMSNIVNYNNDTLAYINYTSGTTGLPKGVLVKWLGVNNLLSHFINEKIFDENDSFLAVTSISFDISVLELLLPLALGANLHLATENDVKDNQKIIQLIEENDITVMQATPSFWGMLFERDWAPPSGFKCLVGGEPFTKSLQQKFFVNSTKVFNLYGPTETTIWSSIKTITAYNNVTIGSPVQNTDIYIMNDFQQELPQYSLGEIIIEGAGVALGYNKNIELSQAKFFRADAYKTGDLGRIINGEVHFEGRVDTQIKLRGYRIELAEIDSVISRHPAVSRVITLLRNDTSGANKILSFVKLKDAHDNDVILQDIKNICSDYLPDYERPSGIVHVEDIPVNINGKIDTEKLFSIYDKINFNTRITSPSTETELKMEKIWQEILKPTAPIGTKNNFFELGGNSLLIAKLVEAINSEFRISIGMRLAFTNPTIESLSKNIDKILSEGSISNKQYELPLLNLEELVYEIN